jgi:hypothetical protein
MPTYRFSISGEAYVSGYVEVDADSQEEAHEMIDNGNWDEEDIDIDCIDCLDEIQFSEIVDGDEDEDEESEE